MLTSNFQLLFINSLSGSVVSEQFGRRSGPTTRRAWSWSKLFDTDGIPKLFFAGFIFYKKNLQTTNVIRNRPACKKLGLVT